MNVKYTLEQEEADKTIRSLWVQILDAQVEVSDYSPSYPF